MDNETAPSVPVQDSPVRESGESAALDELTQAIEQFRQELMGVQRELEQAADAWRSAVATEKEAFHTLLAFKQQAWDEQEAEWQLQRGGYEQKIRELEKFFTDHLQATEQNALKALNELDDSWQREKLSWQRSLSQQTQEWQEREASWRAERQEQALRIQALEQEIAQLQARLAEGEGEHQTHQQQLENLQRSLEAQDSQWQQERILWQEREDFLAAQSRDQVESYVNTLESGVSALQELIRQMILTSSVPLRRKTDTHEPGSVQPLGQN
jgi:chromosome segregation ATPase